MKFLVIAKWEFLEKVRSKAFLIFDSRLAMSKGFTM